MMTPRSDMPTFRRLCPALAEALAQANKGIKATGLDEALIELVKLRASQINGCSFCLDVHVAEARRAGLADAKMLMLPAWREASVFSVRERAALAWAEAVTLVADTHVPDAVYDEARSSFEEGELANLTAAIVAINAWNRVAVAYRFVPKGA